MGTNKTEGVLDDHHNGTRREDDPIHTVPSAGDSGSPEPFVTTVQNVQSGIQNAQSGIENVQSGIQNVQAGIEGVQAAWRTINLNDAIAQYKHIVESQVLTKTGELSQLGTDQLRGFVFEGHAKATYNIDARAKGIAPGRTDAAVAGDVLSDGTVHSPTHPTHDIVIESRNTLRQQFGLDKPTVKGYQAKAYSDAQTTRRQLSQYESNPLGPADQVSTDTMSETVGQRTVTSDPITDPDLRNLTRQAQRGEVRYDPKLAEQRRNQLRYFNFKNAVRNGALIGAAVTTISEAVDFIRNDRSLTADEAARSLQRILIGTADGAARSGVIAVTSDIVGAANPGALMPAMAGANVLYDFAKDLYRLSAGNIDGDDLLVNTVNNAFTSFATFAGVKVGTAAGMMAAGTNLGKAIGLGATIGSAAGPLGAVIGGAVVGLAVSIGAGWVVADAGQGAQVRIQRDIDRLMDATNLNPSLVQLRLIDEMATLSPKETFSWKNLIPMHSIIGDLAEYRQRKHILRDIRSQAALGREQLDERFEATQRQLSEMHEARCIQLQEEFQRVRSAAAASAFQGFQNFIAHEFEAYRRAYAFSFGNLETRRAQLFARQTAHEKALQGEATKRQARGFLIDLLEDVVVLEPTSDVVALVNTFMQQIRSDSLLAGWHYLDKESVLETLSQRAITA